MRTLITNGTIVTAEGSQRADVLIDGETIAAIGADLGEPDPGRDGRGRDDRCDRQVRDPRRDRRPHAHGAAVRRDVRQGHVRDRARGPRRSAGRPPSSTSPSSRAASRSARASTRGTRRPRATPSTDYGFHMIMSDVNDSTLAEMDTLVAEGVPDFKLFTAYPGVFYSDDGAIFRAMQRTAKNGGLIMMHAENGMAIDVVAADEVAAGHTDPYYHGVARYPIFEGEATNRVIRLAEAAGVPGLHRPSVGPGRAGRGPPGARPGRDGLRRDVPAVPVPLARRHGQRLRGRQVRVLAAAAHEGPPGRALDRPRQGRPPGGLHRPLPVRLPRPEGARAGRLPEDPERPARRRGSARPHARRRGRRRPI